MATPLSLILNNDLASVNDNTFLSLLPSFLFSNDSGEGLKITGLSGAVNGSVRFDQNRAIIFTPTNTFSRLTNQASFQYTVTDIYGNTATAKVFITVNSTNRAPSVVNDTAVVEVNETLNIAISKILANDRDPDGNAFSLISVNNPVRGRVVLGSNANILFTPETNYRGSAQFKYTVRDSRGATSKAAVLLKVAAPPVATADVAPVLINRSSIIPAFTLLANDTDPGRNSLRLVGVSNAVKGRVQINSYGNVVFTPENNYTGVAGFSYTLRNSLGLTTTGKVTVNVNPLPTMAMGTNLASISDWSTQIPLMDVFKLSRSWLWNDTYKTITTDLDSNGWLMSVPSNASSTAKPMTIIFPDMPNRYPGGQYIVLYDGEGTLNYTLGATKNLALSRPGRDVIDVNASNIWGIGLEVISTDPNGTNNYIRNIRMVRAALENTYTNTNQIQDFDLDTANLFNPNWISKISRFSTVRFMDWMRTNGSQQENWSDRPTLTNARWSTTKGAPVELMVALANQGNFNPWFNMPHMATDDYVRNFAQYVKDNLEPDKKVYVEYTNEAWNTMFSQTKWINDRAAQEGLTGIQWFARRTAQISNIWKEVFGTDANRVVGVLATQAANSNLGVAAIDYLKSTGNFSAINAIAIAPYFGEYLGAPQYATQVRKMTVNTIFDELTQGGVIKNSSGSALVPGGALQRTYGWMQRYADLARNNNLELLAYEGGQHIVGYGGTQSNQAITNLFIAANRDPRMGQLYQEYLARWNLLGGGLFVHFNDVDSYSKYGSWGMMQNLNDVNNSKYTSLMQMIQPKV